MAERRSQFCAGPNRRVVLQLRDVLILVALLYCRIATTSMICAAFFTDAGLSRCRRRLRDLYDLGMVERTFVDGAEALYSLGPNGLVHALRWCSEHGIDVTPAEARTQIRLPALPLRGHALNVARAYLACRKHLAGVEGAQWLFEGLVRADFRVKPNGPIEAPRRAWWKVAFKPDAALQLVGRDARRCTIFFEIDNGTESSAQVRKKLDAHKIFLKSGQFETLYGEAEFLTLFITTATLTGRARNLLEIGSDIGAGFVLATTLSDLVNRGPLACLCIRVQGVSATLCDILDLNGDRGAAQ